MPKHGFLTPKAIGNRIKSKGLQKLRWYCQMCQKQCRDENGFKCHTMSESHQRQLLLVAENPGQYVGQFSHEFFRDFMFLLSRQYGTRRILANEVYQEYIKDKNHYHMNATRWTTLTGFCMFLGKEGICEIEPSEKGWFIRYIDRSPETLARQAASSKKNKMDKDDDERRMRMIEQQIERALASKKEDVEEETVYTELSRTDEEEKIAFSFKTEASSTASEKDKGNSPPSPSDLPECDRRLQEDPSELSSEATPTPSSSSVSQLPGSNGRERGSDGSGFARPKPQPAKAPVLLPNALKKSVVPGGPSSRAREKKTTADASSRKRKLGVLEEIRMMEERRKEKMNRRDNWLAEGIVVKVVHKKLGERFYKQKGVVEEVRELYTGVVRMVDSGDVIKIDQSHLETVIPSFGKTVLVVNGAYRGLRALLETLDTDNYCVTIKINQGPASGRVVDKVPYEDISKLAS